MKSIPNYCVTLFLFLGLIYPSAFSENAKTSKVDVSSIQYKRDAALDAVTKPLSEIRIEYLKELEARRKEAQAEGDLDGVLAANEVIEHQKIEISFIPFSKDPRTEQIQQKYRQRYDDARITAESQELQINRTYVQDLDSIVKTLTKAGSFESAKQVKNIKEAFISEYKDSRKVSQWEKKLKNHRNFSSVESAVQKPDKIVVIDRFRGSNMDYGQVVAAFEKLGWEVQFLDEPANLDSIENVALYYVFHGNIGRSVYSEDELDLLESRFKSGELSMIVAGSTWVWDHYNKRPQSEFPAVQIGSRLGFKCLNSYGPCLNGKSRISTSGHLSRCNLETVDLGGAVPNTIERHDSVKAFYEALIDSKEGNVAVSIRNRNRLETASCLVWGHGVFIEDQRCADIFNASISYIQDVMNL